VNAKPTESAKRPEQGTDQESEQAEAEPLAPEQLADLWSPEKQQEYRRAYLRQQARRACPGCGDDGSLF